MKALAVLVLVSITLAACASGQNAGGNSSRTPASEEAYQLGEMALVQCTTNFYEARIEKAEIRADGVVEYEVSYPNHRFGGSGCYMFTDKANVLRKLDLVRSYQRPSKLFRAEETFRVGQPVMFVDGFTTGTFMRKEVRPVSFLGTIKALSASGHAQIEITELKLDPLYYKDLSHDQWTQSFGTSAWFDVEKLRKPDNSF